MVLLPALPVCSVRAVMIVDGDAVRHHMPSTRSEEHSSVTSIVIVFTHRFVTNSINFVLADGVRSQK